MTCKISEVAEFTLRGLSKTLSGIPSERWEQEHELWADHHENFPDQISLTVTGIWYGIWDKHKYSVARKKENISNDNLEEITVKPRLYAQFLTEYGGFAGDELPSLRARIFEEWLPSSGYRQAENYEIEVYHLYSKDQKSLRHYEIWIPVAPKK